MSIRLVQRLSLFAIAALLFLVAVPGWAGEVPVYVQATNNLGGYASQNDTAGLGNFATTYDNFTLGSTAQVNQVGWVGSYNSGVGGITSFTIDFWSNSANAPNTLLASYGVSGNAGETFLGNDALGDPTYGYVLGLGSAFTALGGTEYWISIVPNVGFPPQWLWETSSGGDGNAYQCYFGSCGNISADLAFQLDSASGVPEPEILTLLVPGMLVPGILELAVSLRRKLLG
jgi:hypothetical protein